MNQDKKPFSDPRWREWPQTGIKTSGKPVSRKIQKTLDEWLENNTNENKIMAIPKELQGMLDFSNTEPVLKNGATDQQKIIYADWISELFKDHSTDEPFFKH